MRRKHKKSRKQEANVQKLLLLTALTNLITALVKLIGQLTE